MKNLFFLTMIVSLFTLSFGAMAAESESTPAGADLCADEAVAKEKTDDSKAEDKGKPTGAVKEESGTTSD